MKWDGQAYVEDIKYGLFTLLTDKEKQKGKTMSNYAFALLLESSHNGVIDGFSRGIGRMSIVMKCTDDGIEFDFQRTLKDLDDSQITLTWSMAARHIRAWLREDSKISTLFPSDTKHKTEEKDMTTAFDLGAMLSTPPANPQYAAAAELNAEIMNCAREAQENLYRMAMGFKRMRDEKLYMALGYQSFGEYCEREAGMKRQNVYRYIEVVEKLPNDLSHRCDKIGMTKLQLLTTLSDEERTEIIESTDLENTSVRELRERIKELEREKDDLHAECILTDTKRKSEKEQLEKRINALTKAREITQKDIDKLSEEKSELEKQIAKLESRPIEIVVQENDSDKKEISRLKAEIARLEAEASKPVDDISIEFDMKLKSAKSAVRAVCLCALNSGNRLLQRTAYSQLTELIEVFVKRETDINN